MNYSLITDQQFQKRVYGLPNNLKNALNSGSVMGTIGHICQAHYFDNEKTLIIEQLTALVLSGFVAIEDMSKEIAENLEVNKQLADSLYQEIDKKILLSLKDEIKKVYSPFVVPKSAISWDSSKFEQKIVIKEDVVNLKTKPIVGISSETIEITPKEQRDTNIQMHANDTNKIQIISDKEKVVFPKIETDVSAIKLEKPLGEEEAPMILHKETELKPVSAEKKSLAEAFSFSSGQEPAARKESSDLAAKISFGVDAGKEKKNIIQMEKPNVRVVHYSDLNTPAPSFGKEQSFQSPRVFSQSKEINIGFEPKVVKMEEKSTVEIPKKEPEKSFAAPIKSEVNLPAGEEKKIQIPSVEQSSIKIDNGVKIGFSAPKPEFGLSIKAAAEKKAFEDARKQMFGTEQKSEQKPAVKSPDEMQLKDIPVEEDVIDLRKISEQ